MEIGGEIAIWNGILRS
jgi:hypothetical protein